MTSDTDPTEQSSANLATFGQALVFKMLIAAILTLAVFIYFDKTSSLNGHTPEENQKLYAFKREEEEVKEEKPRKESRKDAKAAKTTRRRLHSRKV